MKFYSYIFTLIIGFVFMSCGDSAEEIFEEDRAEIITYLEDNNLIDDAIESSTGFFYIIDDAGNQGIVQGLNNTVTCNYKGFFPDGEVFDENDNIAFTLGNTIEGWRQGIPLIGKGGSIQLFIPSVLGYGRAGTSGIPANQVIFFEVDLLDVE